MRDQHEYKHKDFINYARTSPGASASFLIEVANAVNPEPRRYTSAEEFMKEHLSADKIRKSLFEVAVYKDVYEFPELALTPDDARYKVFKKRRKENEIHIRRVYEAICEILEKQLGQEKQKKAWWKDPRHPAFVATIIGLAMLLIMIYSLFRD